LVAGSIGLALAGSSSALAACGTYGGYDPPESVVVTAPTVSVSVEPGRLNGAIGKVSMSQRVSYADLNLCSAEGAQALKTRVRIAASNICRQLDGMVPYPMQGTGSCYQDAISGGMARAYNAMDDARGQR